MFELFRRLLDRGWLFKESGFGLGLDAASFGVLVCDFSICVAMTVVNVGRASGGGDRRLPFEWRHSRITNR